MQNQHTHTQAQIQSSHCVVCFSFIFSPVSQHLSPTFDAIFLSQHPPYFFLSSLLLPHHFSTFSKLLFLSYLVLTYFL